MMEAALYYLHYGLLLVFGVVLSFAFSGLSFGKSTIRVGAALVLLCGLAQIGALLLFAEEHVWKIYPFITHLPIVLVLGLKYRRNIAAAISATTSAYLCCQIAKWFGLVTQVLTGSAGAEYAVRSLLLVITAAGVLIWFAPAVSHVFLSGRKSAWIFGTIPIVYYAFDYFVGIYTDLWMRNDRITAEFLPLFLCIGHLVFCLVYYREYVQKAAAQHREQLLQITAEQQRKEIDTIRRAEQEVRLVRHDMRLFLNNLRLCIQEGDRETAEKLIDGFSEVVEQPRFRMVRYCESDTLNYILSDFSGRCQEEGIDFSADVVLSQKIREEQVFALILSNALDNAFHAQADLPEGKRSIRLLLKNSNGKLLLHLRNRCGKPPVFVEGMPQSQRGPGHGYGTQSIRFAAERLGGNCRFSMEEGDFLLRVII